MSKNLIIDYLSRIEKQLEELKGIGGKLKYDHVLNVSTIRQQKSKASAEISNDVVNIFGNKYIRDDNRIIISAPEIIIGNVDKNGNLIASDNNAKVIIRSNNISLEGVGKDESSIGNVTTRAQRISQIAVDPGIDGRENVVTSTSEIISLAKGIELRSDKGEHCIERDMNVPVQTGLHLYSPTDIEISSSSSYNKRKSELTSRQTLIEEDIKNMSEEVLNCDSSIATMMAKIRSHANDEVYDLGVLKNINLSISHTEIDAANRLLESYLVALLKEVNTFFHMHSRLYELKRELQVVKSMLDELNDIEEQQLPPMSELKINVPSIRLKSEDGDGNFRKDGRIHFRTHTLSASGRGCSAEEIKHGTIMDIRFNKVNIDTSKSSIDSSGKIHTYTANGKIRLNSKHVEIESVDVVKRKGEKKKEKDLNEGGEITLNAQKTEISSLTKDGKSCGEINLNSKRTKIISHDVDANGKIKETEDSYILLYANTLQMGKVNPERKEETALYSKKIYIGGEKMKINTDYLRICEKSGDNKRKERIAFSSKEGLVLGSNKQIRMFVNGELKEWIESSSVKIWPDLKVMTSITDVPSIVTNNLEVKNYFKTPSTQEGMAVKGPVANSPTEPDEEKDDSKQIVVTKELLPSRKDALKAKEDYEKREQEYKEKVLKAEMMKEKKEHLKAEAKDIEKKIKDETRDQQKIKDLKGELKKKKQEINSARNTLIEANKEVKSAQKAMNDANKKVEEANRKAEKDEKEALESN